MRSFQVVIFPFNNFNEKEWRGALGQIFITPCGCQTIFLYWHYEYITHFGFWNMFNAWYIKSCRKHNIKILTWKIIPLWLITFSVAAIWTVRNCHCHPVIYFYKICDHVVHDVIYFTDIRKIKSSSSEVDHKCLLLVTWEEHSTLDLQNQKTQRNSS